MLLLKSSATVSGLIKFFITCNSNLWINCHKPSFHNISFILTLVCSHRNKLSVSVCWVNHSLVHNYHFHYATSCNKFCNIRTNTTESHNHNITFSKLFKAVSPISNSVLLSYEKSAAKYFFQKFWRSLTAKKILMRLPKLFMQL